MVYFYKHDVNLISEEQNFFLCLFFVVSSVIRFQTVTPMGDMLLTSKLLELLLGIKFYNCGKKNCGNVPDGDKKCGWR